MTTVLLPSNARLFTLVCNTWCYYCCSWPGLNAHAVSRYLPAGCCYLHAWGWPTCSSSTMKHTSGCLPACLPLNLGGVLYLSYFGTVHVDSLGHTRWIVYDVTVVLCSSLRLVV
jgi:hypothetical protein